MRWRFCQRIEHPAGLARLARHPIPLGDALLDKRNASYRWHPLCYTCGTFGGALPWPRCYGDAGKMQLQ